MGRNLKGLDGIVVETWEKCDVDPTCCCAEWVDEGLSVQNQNLRNINKTLKETTIGKQAQQIAAFEEQNKP
eukprot:scaffold80492_cov75-Cyclotella_meneghiniana.AAC.1